MANDTNSRLCQISGTTSPVFGTKEIIKLITWVARSSATTNTTKETIYKTKLTF